MKSTAESKVAQTILQETKTIEVGDKTYEVAPPSIATLIKASEYISQMPEIDSTAEDSTGEVLRTAKDCRVIGDVLATLILGAKRIRNGEKWYNCILRRRSEFGKLSDALLYEKEPKELSAILGDLVANRMDVGFFFQLGTSLSGINMTKPTKTIASGRP